MQQIIKNCKQLLVKQVGFFQNKILFFRSAFHRNLHGLFSRHVKLLPLSFLFHFFFFLSLNSLLFGHFLVRCSSFFRFDAFQKPHHPVVVADVWRAFLAVDFGRFRFGVLVVGGGRGEAGIPGFPGILPRDWRLFRLSGQPQSF